MDWHYEENGIQKGPISERDFCDLIERGQISDETLVWRKGFEGWCLAGSVIGLMTPPPLEETHQSREDRSREDAQPEDAAPTADKPNDESSSVAAESLNSAMPVQLLPASFVRGGSDVPP